MVYARGIAELTKKQRESKYYRLLISGYYITNYVFPCTKFICGGCGEVSIMRRRATRRCRQLFV
jgi:predicted RNA-binding Zn-ribbon protein involved in translation (DUF1610 family)